MIVAKLQQHKLTSIPRGVIRPENPQNKVQKQPILLETKLVSMVLVSLPEYNSIPEHDIVVVWSTADTRRWVLLQPLEIPHQPLPCWSRHPPYLYSTKQKPITSIILTSEHLCESSKHVTNM